MRKAKRAFGLFLVLTMILGVVAPISALGAVGDPFETAIAFSGTNTLYKESNIDGGTQGGIALSTVTAGGYSGGNSIKLTSTSKSAPFLTTTIPNQFNYAGSTKMSFWMKVSSTTLSKVSLMLRDGSATIWSTNVNTSTGFDTWHYCEFNSTDATNPFIDSSGYAFARFRTWRFAVTSSDTTAADVYISDLKFSGSIPALSEPADKTFSMDFKTGFAEDGADKAVTGTCTSSDVAGAGYNGAYAKQISFSTSGSSTSRTAFVLPYVAKPYLNYQGIKYMSFLVKDVTADSGATSSKQNFGFQLKYLGNNTAFSTNVTFTQADCNKWKLVTFNLTDSAGFDFKEIDHVGITLASGQSGILQFCNLILSNQPILSIDASQELTTPITINGAASPTSLTTGLKTVAITGVNTTQSDKNITLIAVLYNKTTGGLVDIKATSGTWYVTPPTGTNTLSTDITVPTDTSKYTLKVFLWNSVTGALPANRLLYTVSQS